MADPDDPSAAPSGPWARVRRRVGPLSWRIVGAGLFAVAMTWVVPVLVVAGIAERAAARGEGVIGTYAVVDDWSCRPASGCDTADFRSDDGRTVERGVFIAGELDSDPGVTGAARLLDGSVYALEFTEWKSTLAFAGFSGFVALCAWIYVSVLRDERRAAARPAEDVPE